MGRCLYYRGPPLLPVMGTSSALACLALHRQAKYQSGAIHCSKPPWPKGQGVGHPIRRLRARAPREVFHTLWWCYARARARETLVHMMWENVCDAARQVRGIIDAPLWPCPDTPTRTMWPSGLGDGLEIHWALPAGAQIPSLSLRQVRCRELRCSSAVRRRSPDPILSLRRIPERCLLPVMRALA